MSGLLFKLDKIFNSLTVNPLFNDEIMPIINNYKIIFEPHLERKIVLFLYMQQINGSDQQLMVLKLLAVGMLSRKVSFLFLGIEKFHANGERKGRCQLL